MLKSLLIGSIVIMSNMANAVESLEVEYFRLVSMNSISTELQTRLENHNFEISEITEIVVNSKDLTFRYKNQICHGRLDLSEYGCVSSAGIRTKFYNAD